MGSEGRRLEIKEIGEYSELSLQSGGDSEVEKYLDCVDHV